MDSENEEPATDRGNPDMQTPQESRPSWKLRDLKPEKDPMGAGKRFSTSPFLDENQNQTPAR